MTRKSKRATKAAERKKKPRATAIWLEFDGNQFLSGISPPNERSELTFYDENGQLVVPKRIEVGTVYHRSKGPKIITRAAANPADILLDVNRHFTNYDWIFAADTNTRTIGAEAVSVTGIFLVRDISFTGPQWSATLFPQPSLELRDARMPPERIGWRYLMWLVARSKLEGKIAVFVDSELDQLAALNKREKELLPSFLVPENVTLLYGSSGVGRAELIGNRAIAECDRYASKLIAKIEAGDVPALDFQTDMPRLCSRYRLWQPSK